MRIIKGMAGSIEMKMLVVYEKTPQAALNLRLALEMARFTVKAVGEKPEILVCVLELLREDKPLDDYLGEMDKTTEIALGRIDRMLVAVGDNLRSHVQVKVLRGMELEAAELVASEAHSWGAELIQLTVDRECKECQRRQFKRQGGWFGRLLGRKAVKPESEVYPVKPLSLNRLMQLTGCRVNVTCHGEKLFTLYMHSAEVNSHKIGN